MTLEEKLVKRFKRSSDDALTERYAGAEVIVNTEVEEGLLEDSYGKIAYFDNGWVIIGGLEKFIDMYAFPVECFETGEIKFSN